MVFSNLFFIYLFLPLNLILYYAVPNKTWKNVVLLLFSLFFYSWGEPVWVFLLMLTAFLDYTWAKCIEYFNLTGQQRRKKIALIASLVFDLGMLGVFKYSGFVVENINLLTGTFPAGTADCFADRYFLLHLPDHQLCAGCLPRTGCSTKAIL